MSGRSRVARLDGVSSEALWIGQCELLDGWDVVAAAPDEMPAAPLEKARVLVRERHRPLGFATVPLEHGRVTTAELQREVSRLRAESRCGARSDQLAKPGEVGGHEPVGAVAPPVTVAICTRDRPRLLARSLAAVQQVEYPTFEILVVDNAPTDTGTRTVVRAAAAADDRVRYVVEPQPGLSHARNRALEAASWEVVAFTDDDVVADRYWLAGLGSGFLTGPEVACVTGLVPAARLLTPAERYFDARVEWSHRMWPARYSLDHAPEGDRLFPYHPGVFGAGANFAVDRSVMSAIGGFDPCLGAGSPTGGGEDLDAFVRVVRASKTLCYQPAAIVWHFHRPEIEGLAAQVRDYGRGIAAVVTKWLLASDTREEVLDRVLPMVNHVAAMWRTRAPARSPLGARLMAMEMLGAAQGTLAYLRARHALTRKPGARPR